jgi:hypothetical protein
MLHRHFEQKLHRHFEQKLQRHFYAYAMDSTYNLNMLTTLHWLDNNNNCA